jgi:hypothetical protein
MQVQATIVADSMAPSGVRLTTMLLTYWTAIHQDILTHRTMYKMTADEAEICLELTANKSTNSNRAKPTRQVLREVLSNPFVPTRFPKRSITMHSSRGYLEGWQAIAARRLWLMARYIAIILALALMWLGVHKQIANRLLMPWLHTTLVITAIDRWWQHFFTLRTHHTAQDEVQDVAKLAEAAFLSHTPTQLAVGEWHLPFVSECERYKWSEGPCIELSVARCARNSYALSHEQMLEVGYARDVAEDFSLYARLDDMWPPHDGPKEHQAMAHSDPTYISGTLLGWVQLRHSSMAATPRSAYDACQPSPRERGAGTA